MGFFRRRHYARPWRAGGSAAPLHAEVLEARRMLSAALLRDVNTSPNSSRPGSFTEFNDQVFFFGSLLGETGDAASLSAIDLALVRRNLNTPAVPDSPYDFDRDGRIMALDLATVRTNFNRSLATPRPAATVSLAAPAPPAPWDERDADVLA